MEAIFAANIQVGQLKKVIPVYEWSPERFEQEREAFLKWLLDMKEKERFSFSDQITAWEVYEAIHEPIEIEEEEFEGKSWQEEIEEIMDKVVNSKDFLANYNYEAGRGLPAQQ